MEMKDDDGEERVWTLKKHKLELELDDERTITKKKSGRSRELTLLNKGLYDQMDNNKSIYLFLGNPTYLCKIPPVWLSYINNYCNNNQPKASPLHLSFNHDLHHQKRPPFAFPEMLFLSVKDEYYPKLLAQAKTGMKYAAWVAIGSTLYFFGCVGEAPRHLHRRGIYYLRKDDIPAFGPTSILGKKRALIRAGCMINARERITAVSLDGKAYIFGRNVGYLSDTVDATNFVRAEVFEPYEGSLKGKCRVLPLPSASRELMDPFCAVAVKKTKKIIVSWGEEFTYEYDIVRETWVKINIPSLYQSICPPVEVDGILYWLASGMSAYDPENNVVCHGPVEDILIQTCLNFSSTKESNVSLLHLAGDFFCIFWLETEKLEVMHCTIVRVIRDVDNNKKKKDLRTIVLSCQTFVSKFKLNLQGPAYML